MKNILKIDIDKRRVYGLDILRCFAILFVVLGHGNWLLPQKIRPYIYDYIVFDGVSIFFVLSGFLIGGILIKILAKEGASFKTLFVFWARRWFRTLPNYFLILILLAGVYLLIKDDFTLRSINRYFFFSQNLFHCHPSWFFPEAWSLSIEEWFYLLIPICIFSLAGTNILNTKGSILCTAVGILSIITLFRLYRYLNITVTNVEEWDLLFSKQVSTRLDSLMYGVIGAYISYYHKMLWLKYKYPIFLLGISIFLITQFFKFGADMGLYSSVFSFSIISLATLFLLPYLSDIKQGEGFIFKSVTYISLISYSMYLLNDSIVRGLIFQNVDPAALSVYGAITMYILYWTVTITLSIILYKYYEVPMTKLRDKIK